MRNFLGTLPTVPKDCEQWRVVPQLVARGQNIVSGRKKMTSRASTRLTKKGRLAVYTWENCNNSVKPRSI